MLKSMKNSKKFIHSNIVASVDCVIDEVTVVKGVSLVKPGDVVKKGDLLISGVTMDENKIFQANILKIVNLKMFTYIFINFFLVEYI